MNISPQGFKMNWLGYENGSIAKGRHGPMPVKAFDVFRNAIVEPGSLIIAVVWLKEELTLLLPHWKVV
ncbi:MAG: hypothetical protein Q7J24_06985 [Desulfomicrobium sp.]|nr:hypothetical protein [Desulfomicrobium sp.]